MNSEIQKNIALSFQNSTNIPTNDSKQLKQENMKHTKTIAIGMMLTASGFIYGQRSSNVEIPSGKSFFIQSAMNYGSNMGGYWDIPGKPTRIEKGSNIQVWNLDEGMDRKFRLRQSPEAGFYEIQIGTTLNSRVDVAGGKTANGTNILTWEENNATNQRFAFVHLGNGRFKIYDRNGKIICLKGKSNANGSNVHIWDDHNGAFTEWYLIDAYAKTVFIPGANPTPQPVAKPAPTPAPDKKTSPVPQVMPTKR